MDREHGPPLQIGRRRLVPEINDESVPFSNWKIIELTQVFTSSLHTVFIHCFLGFIERLYNVRNLITERKRTCSDLGRVLGVDLSPFAGVVLLHEVDDAVGVLPLLGRATGAVLVEDTREHLCVKRYYVT